MRSDPRTAQIPAPIFSAFLPEIREDLIHANIFTPRNHLIARTLIDFLDFNQKVLIHEKNYHLGWTRRVSHAEIAAASGLSERSVIRSIEDMLNKGVLEKQKRRGDVCFCYRFLAYDRLHQYLEENPTSDKVETTHAYRSDSVLKASDTKSDNQEFKDLKAPPRGPRYRFTGKSGQPIRPGGDLNSQKQKPSSTVNPSLSENSSAADSPPSNPKRHKPPERPNAPQHRSKGSHSALPALEQVDEPNIPPPSDIIPNRQIGEILDTLSDETQSTRADDPLEAFMDIFKPPDGVIWSWKDAIPARKLKAQLEATLKANSIEMPIMLFFKHCMHELDNRIADGKLDGRPHSFNFFLNAATGQDIIAFCVSKLSHENRAQREIERTRTYLDEIKRGKQTKGGIPPEAKAQLDQLLGRV